MQISLEAEATNIPPGIEVRRRGHGASATPVHAGDLELPDGRTLAVEPDILVLHVIAAPTAEQIEADLGEAAEAAEAAGRRAPRPRPRRLPSPRASSPAGRAAATPPGRPGYAG